MRHLLLAVALFLPACGGNPTTPAQPIDATVTIAHGETLALAGGVTVRFDAVPEDSRCPINAMCVWAGVAAAKLTVRAGGSESQAEIRSDPAAARVADVQGVHVEWRQLEPYPWAGRPTQPGDYRLTVRVTR